MAEEENRCLGMTIEDMEDDDDFESDGWDEMDGDETVVDCFFCKSTFNNVDLAVSHFSNSHDFDLSKLKGKHKMDCYSFIKLVNFIRTEKPSSDQVMACAEPLWVDDKYLMPVNRDDPWLMFDFDDVEEPAAPSNSHDIAPWCSGYPVNAESGRVTLSEMHFVEMQKTIKNLNAEVTNKNAIITELVCDMKRMKETLRDAVSGAKPSDEMVVPRTVADFKNNEDEDYFESYGHFSIHHEMLSDQVRTLGYRNALERNAALLSGRSLLDLGCGTGILSMLAERAGAGRVIGIDQSEIIFHAMDIVRVNGLADKIELVKGRIEDTELPVDKFDVIVSEWMGFFLVFEAMLDSVIYARDKHLKPGGMLLPNRCTLSIVGAIDLDMRKRYLDFWDDVYGFKMPSMRRDMLKEPHTRIVPSDCVVTEPSLLQEFDLMSVTTTCIQFKTVFDIVAKQDTEVNCLVAYFDVFFDLPSPVEFSTGPLHEPTHWKQTVFLIDKPIAVKKGESIRGTLQCRRNVPEVRSMVVTITIGSEKVDYILR